MSAPIAADDLLSYARLDGDDVRVVLALPDGEVTGPRVMIRWQSDAEHFRARGLVDQAPGRTTVTIRVPRAQLPDGVWHLRLRQDAESPLRELGARVLVHGDQPVALLFGKTANV